MTSNNKLNHEAWARSMIGFIRDRGLESEFQDWCGGWPCRVASPECGKLPADVVALVVAAREALEEGFAIASAADKLDRALEAFASRVCYDDEGGTLPEAHADPCTCADQAGEGGQLEPIDTVPGVGEGSL